MQKIILGVVLGLTFIVTSYAQNQVENKPTEKELVGEGAIAFIKKDYNRALNIFKNQIPNNAKAQGFIGIMYLNGMGVQQDSKEAKKWLDKSAEQGDMDSLNIIASLYVEGKGIKQDYKKAIELYEKSSNSGNNSAKDSLGYLYATGKGVEINLNKAYMYWLQIVNSENPESPVAKRAKNSLKILCERNPEVCK